MLSNFDECCLGSKTLELKDIIAVIYLAAPKSTRRVAKTDYVAKLRMCKYCLLNTADRVNQYYKKRQQQKKKTDG